MAMYGEYWYFSSRWIIVGLIALGVVIAATLLRPGSNATEEGDSDSSEASTASKYDPDGGLATRRITENCDPVAEALKYEEFVDRRALAILRRKDSMPRSTVKRGVAEGR